MRLNSEDIAEAFATPLAKSEKPEPATRQEAARQALDDLDEKMARLVEKHRQPGQSHEQALNALVMENPNLYSAHHQRRAAIIQQHLGMGTE